MYEDLLSSSISICVEGPAAAAAMMSNLICYCSIAAIATGCLYLLHCLPTPHTVWVPCRRFFFVRGALPEKELQGVNVSCHMIFHLVLKGPKLCNTYYIYINYIYICIIYILYYLYIYIYAHAQLAPSLLRPPSCMRVWAGWSSKLTIQNLCLVTRSPFAFSWWQFLTPFRAFCNLMGSLLVIVEM